MPDNRDPIDDMTILAATLKRHDGNKRNNNRRRSIWISIILFLGLCAGILIILTCIPWTGAISTKQEKENINDSKTFDRAQDTQLQTASQKSVSLGDKDQNTPNDRKSKDSSPRLQSTIDLPNNATVISAEQRNKVKDVLQMPRPNLITPCFAGKFNEPVLPPDFTACSSHSWDTACRIVLDETSFTTVQQGEHKGKKFNNWGCLLAWEKNFYSGDLVTTPPHIAIGSTISLNDALQKYGEPSHTGTFVFESGRTAKVYWYGPIFLVGGDLVEPIIAMGGFPSLLFEEKPGTWVKGIRTHFDSMALFPPFREDFKSTSTYPSPDVRIRNPNAFSVLVGIRSGKKGTDREVLPQDTKSFSLPVSNYDIYFVFSNNPNTLVKGDRLKLKDNVEIELSKDLTGKYNTQPLK
jgi:hypothetical protein